jgi:hypothetical protein
VSDYGTFGAWIVRAAEGNCFMFPTDFQTASRPYVIFGIDSGGDTVQIVRVPEGAKGGSVWRVMQTVNGIQTRPLVFNHSRPDGAMNTEEAGSYMRTLQGAATMVHAWRYDVLGLGIHANVPMDGFAAAVDGLAECASDIGQPF